MPKINLILLGMVAVWYFCQPFLVKNHAFAIAVLPAAGAETSASARSVGNDAGVVSDQDDSMASSSNEVTTPDFARGESIASIAGSVGSRSEAEAVSGTNDSTEASATGKWIARFSTNGSDPGSAIDIDFRLVVDGTLSYQNNNSGASAGDISSAVALSLQALSMSAMDSIFDGSAQLTTDTNSTPPTLLRGGDWADASRDGDFEQRAGCDRFRCEVDVVADIALVDAFFVDFSEIFAIEYELVTDAFVFAGFETGAIADFLSTASLEVSTSTPGVSIELVTMSTPVTAPANLPLFAIALCGIFVAAHRKLIAT